MFRQLTTYLLQYKSVSIPSVGTIRLVHQPAQLNVADKTVLPPSFAAKLENDETIPAHQLDYLSAVLQMDSEAVLQSLQQTGDWLKKKMSSGGFDWVGIGIIQPSEIDSFVAEADLKPVPAERVLRHDAAHKVLVGDQQLMSTQITEQREAEAPGTKKERSIIDIIGWIVLVIALLFIVLMLYLGKFRIGATGNRLAPTSTLYRHNSTAIVQDFVL